MTCFLRLWQWHQWWSIAVTCLLRFPRYLWKLFGDIPVWSETSEFINESKRLDIPGHTISREPLFHAGWRVHQNVATAQHARKRWCYYWSLGNRRQSEADSITNLETCPASSLKTQLYKSEGERGEGECRSQLCWPDGCDILPTMKSNHFLKLWCLIMYLNSTESSHACQHIHEHVFNFYFLCLH